jgi:hypothetical protein
MEPEYVSMKDAMRITSLSKSTLNRMVKRDELDKLHIGKKPMFRVTDLRQMMERGTTRMPPHSVR